jgi:hypothetical protein
MQTATPATKPTSVSAAVAGNMPPDVLTLHPVRIAYPHLTKPRTTVFNGIEKTRFEAVLLIPKSDAALVETLKAGIRAAFAKKFGTEAKVAKDKQPIKDGDASPTDDDADPGRYPGYFYANLNAFPDSPPRVLGMDKLPITDPFALGSGDWCHVVVKPRAYSFESSKGVALDVLRVRLIKKGDPIGSGGRLADSTLDALDDVEVIVTSSDDEDF